MLRRPTTIRARSSESLRVGQPLTTTHDARFIEEALKARRKKTSHSADLVSLTDLDYAVCHRIQSYLSSTEVARFAALGSRVWLAAARNTLAARVEITGEVIEISAATYPRENAICLREVICSEGRRYSVRMIEEFDPHKYANNVLADVFIRPAVSDRYSIIPAGIVFNFREVRLSFNPNGYLQLPHFIGLDFCSLFLNFCGFRSKGSEQLFEQFLEMPQLSTLCVACTHLTPSASKTLRNYILNADWVHMELEYSTKAPEFFADHDLLAELIDKWHGKEKPTYRNLKLYSRMNAEQVESIRLIAERLHPVLGHSPRLACSAVTLESGAMQCIMVQMCFAKPE